MTLLRPLRHVFHLRRKALVINIGRHRELGMNERRSGRHHSKHRTHDAARYPKYFYLLPNVQNHLGVDQWHSIRGYGNYSILEWLAERLTNETASTVCHRCDMDSPV
jgi:hypothetical protein